MADAAWGKALEHSDIKLGRIGHYLTIHGKTRTCVKSDIVSYTQNRDVLTVELHDPSVVPYRVDVKFSVPYDPAQQISGSFHLTRECQAEL